MKITTAIEFLKEKSRKRRVQEMNDLKDLLIMCSEGTLCDKNFTIGYLEATDMEINIKNVFFDIDGKSFQDWIEENCIINKRTLTDKSITIITLN
jgi:hypothetical protein